MAAARKTIPGAAQPLKTMRDVITPEGVPLRFELAGRNDRASALVIDFVIMLAVVVGLVVIILLLAFGGVDVSGWALGLGLLLFFA
ncbi:MAG: hypothetical protein OEY16_09915, partial [Alphaproteobacteria bacterium]|nr:hypothetical protein [Alphaproteobacteria bacterium]